ncbi:MAG: LytTR family transcriptional regulator DNA-binding domain-containing protein [Bacteroidales bacterium]|nr:LytTR family transcriptional regulator DNA-binding domain-containing protein [Bacteroidales bacterium]
MCILVKTNRGVEFIRIESIISIESIGKVTEIYMDYETVVTKQSLSSFLDANLGCLQQVNRTTIVNINRIKKININGVILIVINEKPKTIKVTRSFKGKFMNLIKSEFVTI